MRRLLLLLTVLALVACSAGAAIAAQGKAPGAPKSWPTPATQEMRAFTAAGSTQLGNATLRVAGGDRFTTAAAIADEVWDYETTIVVYLANGLSFPDALGLSASTFGLGPLLLVTKDGLPEVTRNQLARLRPCMVVAAGGAGAISDAVLLEADRYADPQGCEGLY